MNLPDAIKTLSPFTLKYFGDWELGPDGMQRGHAVVAFGPVDINDADTTLEYSPIYRPGVMIID